MKSSLLCGALIIINTKLLYLQEVPGLLTCCHRDKGLLEGGLDRLDPRIAAYITDAGLDGLLRIPYMDLDHTLITALVEIWRPETHSFHLPHGEMTITLQDMEVIMGVPVHGLPVVAHYDVPELGGLGYFVKYPSPSSSSMKQDKIKIEEPISSLQFYLSSFVLELDGLGYFTKYLSPPSSGTEQDKINQVGPVDFFLQLRTRAWWARVLCEVPKPNKLEYKAG